jgi:hypothetical protein
VPVRPVFSPQPMAYGYGAAGAYGAADAYGVGDSDQPCQ